MAAVPAEPDHNMEMFLRLLRAMDLNTTSAPKRKKDDSGFELVPITPGPSPHKRMKGFTETCSMCGAQTYKGFSPYAWKQWWNQWTPEQWAAYATAMQTGDHDATTGDPSSGSSSQAPLNGVGA